MFHRLLAAALVAAIVSLTPAQPVTYQGRLDTDGRPADGIYDFEITIHDQLVSGKAVGGPFTLARVTVENGLFQLHIPPDETVFTGDPRFIEIGVKDSANDGPFNTLAPRQPLAATPYALRSLTQAWNNPGATSAILGDGPNGIFAKAFINRDAPIMTGEWFGFTAPTGPFNFGGMVADVSNSAGRPYYAYAAGGEMLGYQYYDTASDRLIFNVAGQNRIFFSDEGIEADAFSYRQSQTRHYWNPAAQELVFDIEGTDSLTIAADGVAAAGPVTAPAFQYSAPRTRYYSITGNALLSSSGNPVRRSFGGTLGLGGAYPLSTGTDAMFAPIHLPDGAAVTRLTAYYIDNSSGTMFFRIFAGFHTSQGGFLYAQYETSGASPGPRSGSVETSLVIDNTRHSYFIRIYSNDWASNDTMRVISVVIEYTVDEPD